MKKGKTARVVKPEPLVRQLAMAYFTSSPHDQSVHAFWLTIILNTNTLGAPPSESPYV